MRIFFESDHDAASEMSFSIVDELNMMTREYNSPQYILKKIYSLFHHVINYSHVILSLTNQNNGKSRYYVYDGNIVHPVFNINISKRYASSLNDTPRFLVRILDENDNVPSINLIKKITSCNHISMIRLRYANECGLISGLMFFSSSNDCYSSDIAKRFFSISKYIVNIFDKCINDDDSFFQNMSEQKTLPLKNLPGMRKTLDLIWKIAKQDCPVLIIGETGTGKEGVADAIYRSSSRSFNPYVKINCGCIPETLMDSELFGYEKGAFTGASQTAMGRMEQADSGVLFLDELGELPQTAQTKMLRVLQEGSFYRVGGRDVITTDVRIIAATHRDLYSMVEQGNFREDLLYRLNVFPIEIPPLRKRVEDIPVLLDFFVRSRAARFGYDEPGLSKDELDRLLRYAWPGNIREMRNLVERAFILWGGNASVPFRISLPEGRHVPQTSPADKAAAGIMVASDWGREFPTLEQMTRTHIRNALLRTGGRVSGPGGAAELLGLPVTTLHSKMRRLGMADVPGLIKRGEIG